MKMLESPQQVVTSIRHTGVGRNPSHPGMPACAGMTETPRHFVT